MRNLAFSDSNAKHSRDELSEIEATVLDSRYLALPSIGPYLSHDRYDNPKAIFKVVVDTLKAVASPKKTYSYADIACANGEFSYYLKKTFPHWNLAAFDFQPEHIETAKSFPGLAGVRLEVKDLFDIDETFDHVSMMGILSTFWDPFEPLEKLLSICRDGGMIFIDGYFSELDVEVRCVWMDKSTPEGRGKWRRDWSVHTQSGLREFLDGKCRKVEFKPVILDVEIPRNPNAPHINAWTFKDDSGRIHLTNGAHMIVDDVMMIIHK